MNSEAKWNVGEEEGYLYISGVYKIQFDKKVPIDAVDHVARIIQELIEKLPEKYEKGQLEHGGNLEDNSPAFLMDSTIEESIDSLVYNLTLRDQLKRRMKGYYNNELV